MPEYPFNLRVSVKSSNKKEHCFIVWTLAVLATYAPNLPVCIDCRGAVATFTAGLHLNSGHHIQSNNATLKYINMPGSA